MPEDLVDEFVFEPGQHLTLRAEIRGEDVPQSYSISQSRRADPAGRRAERIVHDDRCDAEGIFSTGIIAEKGIHGECRGYLE